MFRACAVGIMGLFVAAAGCVPSGQYLDMKQKYEDSQARNRQLEIENDRLRRQMASPGRPVPREHGPLTFEPTEGTEAIPDGLRLTEVTFRSGSAELTSKGKAALDHVAGQIKARGSGRLIVDGHTDTDPIKVSNHASNWELSGKRAAAVIDYLVKKGAVDPQNAHLRGYGEFQPIGAEKAKNRRVEIRFYPTSGGEAERAPAPRSTGAAPKSRASDPTLK